MFALNCWQAETQVGKGKQVREWQRKIPGQRLESTGSAKTNGKIKSEKSKLQKPMESSSRKEKRLSGAKLVGNLT
jgi:hypothetical protein